MSGTEPITRRTSAATSVRSIPTPLRHPTPDLQSLQGAYLRNIEKLERSAEEMSQAGSDIGEEIRRLSRQSSIQSSKNGDINVVRPSVLERMSSNRSSRSGSYSRNIVDLNGHARWGGYSPNGFVTSPVGSVSGSWSHASVSRVASNSRSSRLAQVSEPMMEGKPLDSPLRASFPVHEDEESEQNDNDHTLHARDVSQSSFSRHYDEIAGQIEGALQHVPPSPPKDRSEVYREQALQQLEVGGSGASTPPERPRSSDTYREAQEAFHDFDGVHFSPDTEEFVEVDENGNEIRRVSARSVSGALSFDAASMLRTPRAQPKPQGAPPPPEDMVYYPAPVPRILNLPKRLSQLPAAAVQSKRRTQMLSQLPPEARAAGPWLNDDDLDETAAHRRESSALHSRRTGSSGSGPRAFLNERMSVANMPAQLRADMYFEHPSIQQNVQIQGESAVATLDSILAASATAPVRAFTDHPYAGDVRKSVYSLEKTARRSTATIATQSTPDKKNKRRSTSISGILKRASTDEITTTLKKRNSRASILGDFNEGGNKLRKRSSRLSLGDELDQDLRSEGRIPADEIDEPEFRSGLIAGAQNATIHDGANRVSFAPTVMSSGYRLDDAEQIEQDLKDELEEEDVEEEEPVFVQPSTLLAELQVRKAQQKSRNKTAATAFPRGMHSTLLELDAVEEINKRKRKNQRIALAWEDPHQRALEEDLDRGDEDVPLAMLYPAKNGATTRRVGDGKDFDRPLGLMEKRDMEDNEPLSSRMNRLRGGRPRPNNLPEAEQEAVEAQGEVEDEEEGETLAQRMRRMKTKDALDGAIVDVAPKPGSRPVSTFSADVMAQLGGPEGTGDDKGDVTPAPQNAAGASSTPDPEETLGQRRARLQREREAAGQQRNVSDPATAAARPPMMRSATSLANLLASNPAGMRMAAKNHEPASGSLLANNATMEARQKTQLKNTNLRSSSYILEKPLVDSRAQNNAQLNGNGLLAQQHNSRAPTGGFAAGTYNNGMGGVQLQQTPSAPVFATPTAGYAMNYASQPYGGMMGYPQMQMQQPTMQMQYGNPMAAYGGQQGMGMAGFMGNAFVPQMNGGGTYASYAQNMGGMPYGAMGMGAMGMEAELNPNQRAAIDRWRMGIGS